MTDSIITRETTVCFSGHRPEKLPCHGDENSPVIGALKSMLYDEICTALNDGCNCFVTGLARGVDLWAGEMILNEIAKGRKLCLAAVSPFRGHGDNFIGYDKWVLGNIMYRADRIIYTSDEYSKNCYNDRNEFMVENSGRLIAVVKDYRSGTGSTIRKAKKRGLDLRLINAAELESKAAEILSAQDGRKLIL